MKKSFLFVCFLTIILTFPMLLEAKKPELKITKPKNRDRITVRKIAVEGKSKSLEPGTSITIYVKTNQVYEQGECEIKANGSWRFYPAVIGAEGDREFYAEIFVETESGIRSNVVTIYRVR